jgi:hypothetical protein
MTTETDVSDLRDLVQRYRVSWKVWPELIYVGGEKQQIGYTIELEGSHEPWVNRPEPGCEHCQRVFQALRRIAEWAFPREPRASNYEIQPFDGAIHYWPAHLDRPRVFLAVKILHREGWEQSVDECEERCLKEIEDHLRALGANRV